MYRAQKVLAVILLGWIAIPAFLLGADKLVLRPMVLPQGDMSSIRSEAQKLIQGMLDRGIMQGVSLALVDRNGPIWIEGFGQADVDSGSLVDADTVFRVGSLSKPVTALGVVLAQQQGLLDLDRALDKQLPSFSIRTHTSERPTITPRQLLSHRSGLPSDLRKGMYTQTPFTDVTQLLQDEYLAFAPDSIYSYSNIGYNLLGHLLQHRSGSSFQGYMQRNIFEPLGMMRSSYSAQITLPNLASGHSNGKRELKPPLRDRPALGLFSSANDLGRLLSALLRESVLGINRDVLRSMWIPQLAKDQLTLGLTPGLGWFIEHNQMLGRVVRHGGSTMFYGAEMALLPEHGLGVVVLANGANSSRAARQLAATILALALKIRDWPDGPSMPMAANRWIEADETPAGRYATDLGLLMIDSDDPKLCACIIDRILDMVQFEDGSLGLTPESTASLPASYRALAGLRLRARSKGKQSILVAERDGEEFVLGASIQPQPWDDGWQRRIGRYRTMNPDKHASITGLRIGNQDGVLCLHYRAPHLSDRPVQVPLQPVSADMAVIGGLGRGSGETVRIIEIDGKQWLKFSGYMGEPIDGQ